MAPPLIISETQIRTALRIIGEALEEIPNLKGEKEDKIVPREEKGTKIGIEN